MGTAKGFWNWNAERYARQPIADEASYQKKLAMTQNVLAKDMHVVEFGCGTGSTAIAHAPHVASYHAIDVSEKMIAIAREKAREAGLENMHFSVGTLEEAGLADSSRDAVLALNVLHLVPDLRATVETVARIVKPGGRFVSSTLCLEEFDSALRWVARLMRLIPALPTAAALSADALVATLERGGFRIEERFEPRPGVAFLIARRT